MSEWLTTEEATAAWGVSSRTLTTWHKAGKIEQQPHPTDTHRVLWRRASSITPKPAGELREVTDEDALENERGDYCAVYDPASGTYDIHAGPYRWQGVPGDDVRDWLRWYTYDGGGLTQRDVARASWNVHGRQLTQRQVRCLMRALEVTKSSMPLAPHDLDLPPELAAARVREAKEAVVEQRVRATEVRDLRTAHRKMAARLYGVEQLIAEAVAAVPSRDIVVPGWREPGHCVGAPVTWLVVLSDWHVGHETHEVEAMVRRFVERWHERRRWDRRPVRRLIVCVAGDILDGAGAAEMHTGQRMHQDVSGYAQAVRAAELLSWCVTALAQATPGASLEVHCVPGNHDRGTAGRNDDPEYLVGRLVHALAAAWSPGEWHNHPGGEVVRVPVGAGRVLLTHGCQVRQGKGGDARQLVFPHMAADPAPWWLVVTGHLHEPLCRADGHIWHVRGGALKVRDSYSQRLGYLCRPSQVLVEIDEAQGPRAPHIETLDEAPLSHARG